MFPQDQLTHALIDAARAREKVFKLSDGGGLYVEVMPTGAKYWRLKYRFKGKERRLALGVYPVVSAADAREQRDAAKQALRVGQDPVELRRNGQKIASPISFRLTLDAAGALTIDTLTQQLTLTLAQTNAVRCFLHDAACGGAANAD